MSMAPGQTVYSFRDTSGAIVSALAGPFQLTGGDLGAGKFVISNTTDHSSQQTAADAAVMVSFEAGDAGEFTIDCQQTSPIHKFLLFMNNLHVTAASAGDVSNWASSAIQLRNIVDGSQHLLQGVSIVKTPPKTYEGRGGMITWTLLAANVVNL